MNTGMLDSDAATLLLALAWFKRREAVRGAGSALPEGDLSPSLATVETLLRRGLLSDVGDRLAPNERAEEILWWVARVKQ